MQHFDCDEERDENGRRLPMKVYQLMSATKRAGTTKNLDKTATVERVPRQPVLVKDLIASEKSCRKSQAVSISDRRISAFTPSTSLFRQLYKDHSRDLVSSRRTFTVEDYGVNEKAELGPNFTRFTSKRIPMSGISKSEGKVKDKNEHLQHEPQKAKGLMKSWEKSQTVHHPARRTQCGLGNVRTKSARRKLYIMPSPKLSRKSLLVTKSKTNLKQNTEHEENGDRIEPNVKVERQKTNRKSFLLPPNAIRDKYIKQKADESIWNDLEDMAEIPEGDETRNGSKDSLNAKKSKPTDDCVTDNDCAEHYQNHLRETDINQENNKDINKSSTNNEFFEVPRPTVIMGMFSAKGSRKSPSSISNESKKSSRKSQSNGSKESKKLSRKSQSNDSNESKKSSEYTIKIPPPQEANQNALPCLQRIDATNTSLEDLLGKPCAIDTTQNDSSPCNVLPYTSFLEQVESKNKSLVEMDTQSLIWLCENCKRTIEATEESLFSMKRILGTIEAILQSKTSADSNEENVAKIDGDEPKKQELATITKIHLNGSVIKESKDPMPLTERNTNALQISPIGEIDVESAKEKNNNEDKENNSFNNSVENVAPVTSPKCTEDSFTQIEKHLNIRTSSPRNQIGKNSGKPRQCKTVDSRSRKSIREYMAMKATIGFLQTPDAKGLLTPADEKDTPSRRKQMKRSISRHLLTQLHDLYDESPETD